VQKKKKKKSRDFDMNVENLEPNGKKRKKGKKKED